MLEAVGLAQGTDHVIGIAEESALGCLRNQLREEGRGIRGEREALECQGQDLWHDGLGPVLPPCGLLRVVPAALVSPVADDLHLAADELGQLGQPQHLGQADRELQDGDPEGPRVRRQRGLGPGAAAGGLHGVEARAAEALPRPAAVHGLRGDGEGREGHQAVVVPLPEAERWVALVGASGEERRQGPAEGVAHSRHGLACRGVQGRDELCPVRRPHEARHLVHHARVHLEAAEADGRHAETSHDLLHVHVVVGRGERRHAPAALAPGLGMVKHALRRVRCVRDHDSWLPAELR
mmetsp:Transcript_72139/g.198963  ORF Transcript_72139/g.198963 Transcript_72139/m.198963 type:complete len:294 (-) Transcript_72139:423-1304(-)